MIWQIEVHVPQVIGPMFFIKLFFESNNQVVVLYWVCDLKQFLGNEAIIKKVCDFAPVIQSTLLQALSGISHRLMGGEFISSLFGDIGRHSIISVWASVWTFLFGLRYETLLMILFGFIAVFQESGVRKDFILNTFFNFLSLLYFFSFVDFSSFLDNASFLVENVDVYYIVFVEFFSPSIRDAVFYLIF